MSHAVIIRFLFDHEPDKNFRKTFFLVFVLVFFHVCENKKDVNENKSFVLFHFSMPEPSVLSFLIDHIAVLFPVSLFPFTSLS